ncbi:MAG: FecR family protein [Acidobacteriota bacterium]|nr:FecR family protein [Acidobacteriota bacterium]
MTEQTTILRQPGDDGARSEDEIRQLLESAGRRPEIPVADFHVVKAAARAEWLNTVDARRRPRLIRRLVPAALAAALAVAVGAFWLLRSEDAHTVRPVVATIELIRGDVWLEEPAKPAPPDGSRLAVGGSLAQGVELVTGSAADGLADLIAIRLGGGQSVRFDSQTRARLGSPSRLELLQGAVYIDSGLSPASPAAVEVVTPYGTVVDVGTQFEVRLGGVEDTLRVRVRTGSVSLIRGEERHAAAVGEELNLQPDGSVEKGSFDLFGTDWDWILSAAPSIDIEGLALARFLEWVAAETALHLDYEDEELALSAEAIELHGTIEGLRPDEAVAAVLLGTGLDHHVEKGILAISRGSTFGGA